MRQGDDECWTMTEAKSEQGAKKLCEMKWREKWRAIEAKEAATFILVLDAGDPEKEQAAMLENMKKLANKNSKSIVTPLGEFASIGEAAKHYGTRHKLMTLIKNQPEEYYFKQ